MATALDQGMDGRPGLAGTAHAVEVFFIEEDVLEAVEVLAVPTGSSPAVPATSATLAVEAALGAVPPAEATAARPSVAHPKAAQRVLLGAFGLDLLLYGLVVPFLPGRAYHLGATSIVTGALFGSYAAGLFLATPLAGWLTDRLGGRRTLLAGLAALFATTLLFAFATDLPLLFVARAAQGAAGAFTWTAGLALMAQLADDRDRPAAFARIFVATGVGILLGPPLGGALYTWGGFRAPFLVAIVLVALDGLARLLFLPGRDPIGRTEASNGATRTLLRDRRFLLALVATAVGAGVLALLEPSMPPLLEARFGLRPLDIGLFFAGTVLVNTLALPLVAYTTRQLGAEASIVFGLLAAALALIMLAVSTSPVHVSVALAAVGFAAPFTLVPTLELLTVIGQGDRPPARVPYGAIYAAYNFAYAGGIFLGPLASGFTIAKLGSTVGLALPAALPLLLGLLMFVGLNLARPRTSRPHNRVAVE